MAQVAVCTLEQRRCKQYSFHGRTQTHLKREPLRQFLTRHSSRLYLSPSINEPLKRPMAVTTLMKGPFRRDLLEDIHLERFNQ
jgi:hypothetical protein